MTAIGRRRAVEGLRHLGQAPRRSEGEIHLLPCAGKARSVSGLYRARLKPFPWRHDGPDHRPAQPGESGQARARRAHALHGRTWKRAPDTSIDMGTAFDCFDVKAHTQVPGLTPEQQQNRQMLVEAMSRQGFKNYEKEWWHYTLEGEPYPDTVFDFPIAPRAQGATPAEVREIAGSYGLGAWRRPAAPIRRGRRARAARGAPGLRRSRSRSAAHRGASG